MSTELICGVPEESLRSIQAKMKDNSITGVPISRADRLLGIVSVDDIIRALDEGHIDEAAESHMTSSLIVLEDDMPLSFAVSYMDKYSFGRYPVLSKQNELVGIITSRDIIVALLLEINREIEKRERIQQERRAAEADPSDSSPTGGIRRSFPTRKLDFEHAGKASSEIKKLLKDYGVASATLRRIAVAAYELEMNQVVHSHGGTMYLALDRGRVTITAEDAGPGIPDVEAALQEGFSTATEWIRSLGFGAGMGLPNTRRVADEFSVESAAGTGTKVTAVIYVEAKHEAE
jgi:CBS domain-containing protein/anti-sigma regulatory factor (Ser/Thr protein kinase)